MPGTYWVQEESLHNRCLKTWWQKKKKKPKVKKHPSTQTLCSRYTEMSLICWNHPSQAPHFHQLEWSSACAWQDHLSLPSTATAWPRHPDLPWTPGGLTTSCLLFLFTLVTRDPRFTGHPRPNRASCIPKSDLISASASTPQIFPRWLLERSESADQ